MTIARWVGPAAVFLTGIFGTAAASAQTVELGQTTRPIVLSTCATPPTGCDSIAARTTVLQSFSNALDYPDAATRRGSITSFTISLNRLSNNSSTEEQDVGLLNRAYGGEPRAALVILSHTLRPFQYKVVRESATYDLTPYLGTIAHFRLTRSLPLEAGDLIGLTVPTWAPAIQNGFNPNSVAYRESRTTNCSNPPSQQTSRAVGSRADYICSYTGMRAEYSATEAISAGSRPLVIAPFDLAVVVNPYSGHPGELIMARILIKGHFGDHYLNVSGGCINCASVRSSKPGSLDIVRKTPTSVTIVSRPTSVFTDRTLIIQDVTSPGAIGRYKLYKAEPSSINTQVIAQGCTPPGVTLDADNAKHPQQIPRTHCP